MTITPTMIDGAVIGTILLSAIFAWSRGLTREVFGLAGWLIAGTAALYFYPMVQPTVAGFVNSNVLAKWGSLAAVFVAALIVLSFVTPILSGAIGRSALGGVDKGLGFLFGAVRGLALVAIVLVGYQAIVAEEDRMSAVMEARTLPLVEEGASVLLSYTPREVPPFFRFAFSDLLGGGPAEDSGEGQGETTL